MRCLFVCLFVCCQLNTSSAKRSEYRCYSNLWERIFQGRRKRNGGCMGRSRTCYVVDDTELEHSRRVWKEERGGNLRLRDLDP